MTQDSSPAGGVRAAGKTPTFPTRSRCPQRPLQAHRRPVQVSECSAVRERPIKSS